MFNRRKSDKKLSARIPRIFRSAEEGLSNKSLEEFPSCWDTVLQGSEEE